MTSLNGSLLYREKLKIWLMKLEAQSAMRWMMPHLILRTLSTVWMRM